MSHDRLTRHARTRAQSRAIPQDQIDLTLAWGREAHVRGARIYAIGRHEVDDASRDGVDLSAAEGVHVVCSHDGVVITVYRNRSLSGLRRRARRAA